MTNMPLMRRFFRIALFCAVLLAAPVLSRAGGPASPPVGADVDQWTALLDRYELICRQCLDLKRRQEAGLDVPAGQMLSLLEELDRLRAEIRSASDKMPASARSRFEAIRKMYATGVVLDTRPVTLAAAPAFPKATLAIPATPAPAARDAFPPWILRCYTPPTGGPPWWILAFFSPLVLPEFSPGVMATFLPEKMGGYAAFRSNFSLHRSTYDARSDGTAGSALIWTSGASAVDRLFVTAGPVLRVNRRLRLFAGAGYGFRRLYWEDTDGDWARITDASRSGLCIEGGALFLRGCFSFSAGGLLLGGSYPALSLSVGYGFR